MREFFADENGSVYRFEVNGRERPVPVGMTVAPLTRFDKRILRRVEGRRDVLRKFLAAVFGVAVAKALTSDGTADAVSSPSCGTCVITYACGGCRLWDGRIGKIRRFYRANHYSRGCYDYCGETCVSGLCGSGTA